MSIRQLFKPDFYVCRYEFRNDKSSPGSFSSGSGFFPVSANDEAQAMEKAAYQVRRYVPEKGWLSVSVSRPNIIERIMAR